MLSVDAAQVNLTLDHKSLIEHLRHAFRSSSIAVPLRHHHSLPVPQLPTLETSKSSPEGFDKLNDSETTKSLPSEQPLAENESPDISESQKPERDSGKASTASSTSPMLLLMPSWQTASAAGKQRYAGVKYLSVFPNNIAHRLPTISGLYILSSAETGIPLAVIDGTSLTTWRTACASALAADYLAWSDARVLVMVGAGAVAPQLIMAHLTMRPSISDVLIWNRSPSRAIALTVHLRQLLGGVNVEAVDDLEGAVRRADVVSCATLAAAPVVRGAWLRSGVHVDLVGAYTATTRESDDDVMLRAKGKIYVDTRVGALQEGGDVVIPLKNGVISEADIKGELSELTSGTIPGRTSEEEITVFKSVGTALEDLAAAQLVYERLTK